MATPTIRPWTVSASGCGKRVAAGCSRGRSPVRPAINPSFARLLAQLREDDVVVTRLDRLDRPSGTLLEIAAITRTKDARLQSLAEP